VPLFLRPGGAFTPPEAPDVPLIMVGPGTGVAPFRGFLQRRAAARAAAAADAAAAFAPAWLFFGCRGEEEDFLYRDELRAWAADGTLTRLVTAFSRPPGGGPKTYVQHRMAELGAELAALIAPTDARKPAMVFVCGDGAGMAKGVHAALLGACPPRPLQAPRLVTHTRDAHRRRADLLQQHAGLSAADAAASLADMAKSGRYVRDIWSS
jgi:NADPH-ferrihemoprotein reductase